MKLYNLTFLKMNMKLKPLLYSLMIGGITLAGCSADNDNSTEPVLPPDDSNLEEGYLTFQSSLESSLGTKSYTGTEDGIDAENKVSRIRVVLYDAATNIANYAYEYSGTALHSTGQDFKGTCMLDPTSTDAPSGYNPNYKGFMIQAMKLKVKPYKLLVLINPSDDIVKLTRAAKEFVNIPPSATPADNATNLSNADFFRDKTGTANQNNLTAFIGKPNHKDNPDNFLMSNYQEYVELSNADFRTTVAEAYKAPVSVKVDRAVAKVSMKGDYAAISAKSKAEVSDGTWRLDVTNKTAYWMRHKAKALKGADEVSTLRENFYAEDPNFDLYSWARYTYVGQIPPAGLVTNSEADIKNYFNYIAKGDVNITLDDQWSYEYALENTMAAEEQAEDVTTAAILKIKFIPKTTSMGNALSAPGYYVWGTYVFTGLELDSIKNYNTSTNDPRFETFVTLKNYLMTNSAVLEAVGSGFGDAFSDPGSASKKVLDISYNHDAINYYRILIRHFDDDQEDTKMAYGRYGVVRNNWYRITLNSIANAGSIDIPDPDKWDDKEQLLSVSIEVLPWQVRDQIIDVE